MLSKIKNKLIAIAPYAALLLLAALITMYEITFSRMLTDHARNSVQMMYDGTAERPYVRRTLLPQTARLIVAVTPQGLQDWVGEVVTGTDTFQTFTGFVHDNSFSEGVLNPKNTYMLLVIAGLLYASLLVYSFTLKRLSGIWFPDTRYTPWATAFMGLAALVPIIDTDAKLYDFPSLALGALAILTLQRERWGAYLALFVLACINKETAILYTGFFAMAFYGRMPAKRYVTMLALQALIFLCVISTIHHLYAGNPGVDFAFHPLDGVFTSFGDLGDTNHFLTLVVFYWILSRNWGDLPFLLKASLWVLVGDVGVYYAFGRFQEYRVFMDAFPGLTIIAGHSLLKALERHSARGHC